MKDVPNVFYLKKSVGKKYKCHVIARTQDSDEVIITYKYYGRHKQYWHYEVEPEELLLFNINLTNGLRK